MKIFNKELNYKILMLASLGLSLMSVEATFTHILDEAYLVSDITRGESHGWYHLFREVIASISIIVAIAMLTLIPARQRTSYAWWVMLVLVLGHYSGYWIGYPWHGIAAPMLAAELNHIAQAILGISALVVAKPFYRKQQD